MGWELLLRKGEVRIIRKPHNGSGVERRANGGAEYQTIGLPDGSARINLKRLNEVLGNHRRQSQETRLEFGVGFSRRFRGANDLDCARTSRRRKAFRCARR